MFAPLTAALLYLSSGYPEQAEQKRVIFMMPAVRCAPVCSSCEYAYEFDSEFLIVEPHGVVNRNPLMPINYRRPLQEADTYGSTVRFEAASIHTDRIYDTQLVY